MSFRDQPFQQRLSQMGDIAEDVFDRLWPNHHKLGLNRPPLNVAKMPRDVRYTPDRLVHDRFVEIQGIGKDQTLKLKVEKVEALHAWTFLAPVDLFVYDSHQHRWWQSPLYEWWTACTTYGRRDTFPEGKEYLALHADHFPGETYGTVDP